MLDPLRIKKSVSENIAAANHAPIERAYNVEIIQLMLYNPFGVARKVRLSEHQNDFVGLLSKGASCPVRTRQMLAGQNCN